MGEVGQKIEGAEIGLEPVTLSKNPETSTNNLAIYKRDWTIEVTDLEKKEVV